LVPQHLPRSPPTRPCHLSHTAISGMTPLSDFALMFTCLEFVAGIAV
jgi:hypothetical protein